MNKNNKMPVNQLTDEQDRMRMQAVDLELKARYWKAQYDIRYYTLEAEKLQDDYAAWVKVQEEKNAEAMAHLQEEMAKLKENEGVEVVEKNAENGGR